MFVIPTRRNDKVQTLQGLVDSDQEEMRSKPS